MDSVEPLDLDAARADQQLRNHVLMAEALRLLNTLADNEGALTAIVRAGRTYDDGPNQPSGEHSQAGRVLGFPGAKAR